MSTEKSGLMADASKDTFVERVRAGHRVTLGAAKKYAATLEPEAQAGFTGCYSITCPQEASCCAGRCLGWYCPIECCGGCLWTPSWFCFADILIGLCFANCLGPEPGMASCSDLKGNYYALVKVDGERGTLAWFNENQVLSNKGDQLENTCYCFK